MAGIVTSLARDRHLSVAVVVSTLRIVPPPSRHQEVLELLRSVKGPTQAQPDCMSYRVYEEDDPERSILLLEEWTSDVVFYEYIRSELFRRVLAALELSRCAPEVAIRHVSNSDGLDLIQRLRSEGDSTPALQSTPTSQ